MAYRNRVDAFGAIHAVPDRGLFTGNRGIIHDPATRCLLKRRWSSKAWIVCDCGYKGRRRDVMGENGPNGSPGWTNLFFLDEVTALAAGHRPCFECRRPHADAFARCFAAGRGNSRLRARDIDAILHRERLASGGKPTALQARDAIALPDGAVVACGGTACALRAGFALPWSFAGYGVARPVSALVRSAVTLVTPPSSLAALRAGYIPVWHSSGDRPPTRNANRSQ